MGLELSLARVPDDFLSYQYQVLGILDYLAAPDVTEICINRPGQFYLERADGWRCVDAPECGGQDRLRTGRTA